MVSGALSVIDVKQVQVYRDPLTQALNEPCVQNWLSGLRKVTKAPYRSLFKYWLLWLWKQPGWENKRPAEPLDFQENAIGRQRKLLLQLMQEFVQAQGGTYRSMIVNLSHRRSFFLRNGVEVLLALHWNPEPTKELT